jgi:catechol 2,3-dioxygenase-like lactoylglutathione lyase family enzyme
MGVIGIDHVLLAIPVGSEPEARAFYCGVLGFAEIAKLTPWPAAADYG